MSSTHSKNEETLAVILEEINKNTDLQICIGDTLYVKCYMY